MIAQRGTSIAMFEYATRGVDNSNYPRMSHLWDVAVDPNCNYRQATQLPCILSAKTLTNSS